MNQKTVAAGILLLSLVVMGAPRAVAQLLDRPSEKVAGADWYQIDRPELVEISEKVLAMPDIPLEAREEIIRIRALEMDWDIAAMIYQPVDESRIPTGADGKKVGVFLLHGGSGDHRSLDYLARFLVSKFGYKIVNMSYPGRLYLHDPSRNWPGDTMRTENGVRLMRTPVWLRGEEITPDQYDVVEDREESRRRRWGTLTLACAKEGTTFYNRMAGWPVAFEEGGKALLAQHLPEGEYSIYAHGHSTGGPFTMIFSQRVPNMAGILGMESSAFGALYGKMMRDVQGIQETWDAPFNCLRIRSWRDTARYYGFELIQQEGEKALERLAMVMEEVLERWPRNTRTAQFKAENIIHFDNPEGLTNAAMATARRLNMTEADMKKLVDHYVGFLSELPGPDAKPVPPLFLSITKNSRDHAPEIYRDVYLPGYAAMEPAPRIRMVQFDAGTHGYSAAEQGLPMGVAPVGAFLWLEAIQGGFFNPTGR